MKRAKGYKNSLTLFDKTQRYSVMEALELVKKTSYVKYDAQVRVSFHLNVDPRQADQQIRGAVVLPNGTGKTRKVLVVTRGAKMEEAKKEENAGKTVVALLPDTGDRYYSTPLFTE